MISLGNGQIALGDCLDVMRSVPSGSVDMILCDLPYGTTACSWDSVIPFVPLWSEYWRICKGAVVLTAAQPFTSALVMSQVDRFRYEWIWEKSKGTGHAHVKRRPMRKVEDVTVFYERQPTYNPQMRPGGYVSRKTQPGQSDGFGKVTGVDHGRKVEGLYPVDLLHIESHDPNNSIHPTQKPVALFEYLIRTYTNEGDTVLDNCLGSGTTAVAAENTGRRWIGIERDPGYFGAACERIARLVSA